MRKVLKAVPYSDRSKSDRRQLGGIESPGRPLPARTRGLMESRFEHDFGKVRIHADSQATRSGMGSHAAAYTVGSQIVFAAGQYTPETPTGQRLLAHELAHVVQQSTVQTRADGDQMPAHRRNSFETEADRAANRIHAGLEATGLSRLSAPAIQCSDGTTTTTTLPVWLNGISVGPNVQGEIYEIDLETHGPSWVGPYDQLVRFLDTQGISAEFQAHHIVGGEHLTDVNSSYTYSKAPAVALATKYHQQVISSAISKEQKLFFGGRQTQSYGRPIGVTSDELVAFYSNVYTEYTREPKLSKIAENVIRTAPPASPPPTAPAKTPTSPKTKAPSPSSSKGPAIGGAAVLGVQVAGQILGSLANKRQREKAEEALLALSPKMEAAMAESPEMGVLIMMHFAKIDPLLVDPSAHGMIVEEFLYADYLLAANLESARELYEAMAFAGAVGRVYITYLQWWPSATSSENPYSWVD